MDFNKYMITKKWWQVSQFQVFDKDGHFVFRSATLGLNIRRMVFLNSSNDVFLLSKPVSTFSYNYNFIRDDTIIGSLERNWSSSKFTIRGINSDTILFKINYWNGDISIVSEGVEIGKGSAKNNYSHIGVAIQNKFDPTCILASLIIICSLKVKGYS